MTNGCPDEEIASEQPPLYSGGVKSGQKCRATWMVREDDCFRGSERGGRRRERKIEREAEGGSSSPECLAIPCDSGESGRRSALKYAPFQAACAFHGAPEKSYVDDA